ncbi:MAG: hypothetical protein ACP5VN_10415 [Acidobacteriota bacterium]
MNQKRRFDTLAIHAGQPPEPATGAIMTPIYLGGGRPPCYL